MVAVEIIVAAGVVAMSLAAAAYARARSREGGSSHNGGDDAISPTEAADEIVEIDIEEGETVSVEEVAEQLEVDEPSTEFETLEPVSLQEVDGVGPAYEEALNEAGFETIGGVARADVEEIAEADGIGETRAESIREAAAGYVGEFVPQDTVHDGSDA